jgi:hypothetical protein
MDMVKLGQILLRVDKSKVSDDFWKKEKASFMKISKDSEEFEKCHNNGRSIIFNI